MGIETSLLKNAVNARHMLRCIVELTPLCNLSCEMCGISLKRDEVFSYGRILQVNEWLILIDQLFEYGVLHLVFSGGEPLLYSGFEQLYSHAYNKGFLIEIRTNGLLLPKYKDLFSKLPPKSIGISIYGSSNDMYKLMTGNENGFSQLLKALDAMNNIKCHLHFTCTMTKTNVSCFPDIAKLANKYNASIGMITDIFPHIKGKKNNILTRLSPAERAAIAKFPPLEYQTALSIAHELENKYSQYFNLEIQEKENTLNTCNGCKANACIKWNGRLSFCPEFEELYSEPLRIGVADAWNQLLNKFNEHSMKNKQCATCGIRDYCVGACPARFFLETGDYQRPCDSICKTAYYSKLLDLIERR